MSDDRKLDEIDEFKRRTLEAHTGREEPPRNWPIAADDLLEVPCCPLCGGSEQTLIAELRLENLPILRTVSCARSLFVYRQVSPDLAWFERCWHAIENDEPSVFSPEIEAIRRRRYTAYVELVGAHRASPGRMLDIGAAYGSGCEVFAAAGWLPEAVEPEVNKYRHLQEVLGVPLKARSIEEAIDHGIGGYELIIAAHCLEHFDGPAEKLAAMREMLADGGLLYVEVPLLWNFVTWTDALYMTHKSNFAEPHIVALARRVGFEVVECGYHRQNSEEHEDFGLLLRKVVQDESVVIPREPDRDMSDVEALYRRGLSFVPPAGPLIFRTSAIEHFFQTVRLDRTGPRLASDGVIELVAHA